MNNLMINGYWTPQSGFANCRLWSALRQPNVEPYGHFLTSLIWHIGMSSYPVCHAWTMVLLRSSVVRTCPKCMYVCMGICNFIMLVLQWLNTRSCNIQTFIPKKTYSNQKKSNHLWYKPFSPKWRANVFWKWLPKLMHPCDPSAWTPPEAMRNIPGVNLRTWMVGIPSFSYFGIRVFSKLAWIQNLVNNG